MFALLASAYAAELTPALALPSAVAVEAGGGQAAVGERQAGSTAEVKVVGP